MVSRICTDGGRAVVGQQAVGGNSRGRLADFLPPPLRANQYPHQRQALTLNKPSGPACTVGGLARSFTPEPRRGGSSCHLPAARTQRRRVCSIPVAAASEGEAEAPLPNGKTVCGPRGWWYYIGSRELKEVLGHRRGSTRNRGEAARPRAALRAPWPGKTTMALVIAS